MATVHVFKGQWHFLPFFHVYSLKNSNIIQLILLMAIAASVIA